MNRAGSSNVRCAPGRGVFFCGKNHSNGKNFTSFRPIESWSGAIDARARGGEYDPLCVCVRATTVRALGEKWKIDQKSTFSATNLHPRFDNSRTDSLIEVGNVSFDAHDRAACDAALCDCRRVAAGTVLGKD